MVAIDLFDLDPEVLSRKPKRRASRAPACQAKSDLLSGEGRLKPIDEKEKVEDDKSQGECVSIQRHRLDKQGIRRESPHDFMSCCGLTFSLKYPCRAHASANAHSDHPESGGPTLHLVEKSGSKLGARASEGVAQGDGTAVDVDPSGI